MTRSQTNKSNFTASIDLDAEGKHFGHIQIPYSRDTAALGNLMIPIVSIKGAPGPCVLLNAGTHGDEFEGQIALRNLAHSLDSEQINGQIIIVPSINPPATLNNSRCSPIDDKNMNRIFPGDHVGSMSEKIASYFVQELVQRADCVVDLHAGGSNYSCLVYPMMHRYLNADTHKKTLDLMKVFQAPFGVIFETEPDRDGMLDTAVEDLDKPFVAVELGSSGTCTPASVELTRRGIQNVLVHLGIIQGTIEYAEQETQLLGVPENGFVIADDHGIFEPFVSLGEHIADGAVVGQLHSIHRVDRKPIPQIVKDGGRVLIMRSTGTTTHGDCLLVVARDLDPSAQKEQNA